MASSQVLSHGRVRRAMLGVSVQTRAVPARLAHELPNAAKTCVEIVQVLSPSPAAEAGFQDGDILLRLGDQALPNALTLQRALRLLRPGLPVAAEIVRAEKLEMLTVKPSQQRAWMGLDPSPRNRHHWPFGYGGTQHRISG